MRRIILAFAALVVVLLVSAVAGSGASFTSSTTSAISVASTASVTGWLHMYSQTTDPDGLGNYYQKQGGSGRAATGGDFSLAVDLGNEPRGSTTTCNRVFTIATPSTLPSGTSCTVTATLIADPTTSRQPITAIGFATVGSTSRSNPIVLTAGQKRQLNLQVRPGYPRGSVYHPTIVITVTYPGYTGGFYQYSVPLIVTAD